MKLGIIGIDSSHAPEFARRIGAMNDAGATPCRVTHYWTDGRHDWPNADDVEKWRADTEAMGVKPAASFEDLLDTVDGALVLAVNGHRHLAFALPCLERALPTYVDKPLTCSMDEAKRLLGAARAHKAPCYSASSLRFATELESIDRESLGNLVAVDAYGAGELLDMMPGLWHYGCHTIEMVDSIWGTGPWGTGGGGKRVSAIELPDRHLVDLEYRDGRYARLRLERKGAWGFGATIHGEKGAHQFHVDFAPVYTRLVQGMVRFFEGKGAPVELRDIVETVAVMEAGNRSIARSGEWIDIESIP